MSGTRKYAIRRGYRRAYTTTGGKRLRGNPVVRRIVHIPAPLVGRARVGGFYGRYAGSTAPELKFKDTTIALTTIANTGTILSPSINLVKQGNGESEMVGRKFVIKSIMARITVRFPADTDAALGNVLGGDPYRVCLVLDKQANGAAGTIAQVFEDTDIESMNDLEFSQRFVIIKEWKGTFNVDVAFDNNTNLYFHGHQQRCFKWYKKCNIPIEMGPNAGARVIADVRSNNLIVMGFTSGGKTQMSYRFRIRYADT